MVKRTLPDAETLAAGTPDALANVAAALAASAAGR
jgi:hypothetical protein